MPTAAHRPQIIWFLVLSLFLALPAQSVLADKVLAKPPFTIEDYFKTQRVVELSHSSDGTMVAFAVDIQSLEENKSLRTVYISSTVPSAKPILIGDIQSARDFAWMPTEFVVYPKTGHAMQLLRRQKRICGIEP